MYNKLILYCYKKNLNRFKQLCDNYRIYEDVVKNLNKKDILSNVSIKPFVNKKRYIRKAYDIKKLLGKERIKYHLDIGIGNGYITDALQNVLNTTTYGIDIEDERANDVKGKFKFQTYNGIDIPYGEFDLVTLLMVLHHIKNLNEFMKRLSLISNKYIIIREHNATTNEDKKFIQLQHIFAMKSGDSFYTNEVYENYNSCQYWIKLFNKYGYKKLKTITYTEHNPTNYFYSVFIKK